MDFTTNPSEAPAGDDVELDEARIRDLPKEVGALLVSVGVLGVILPGVAGAPALVAGGLVLWPKTFGGVEHWLHERFPASHRFSMRQIGRYLKDLNRRYPEPSDS